MKILTVLALLITTPVIAQLQPPKTKVMETGGISDSLVATQVVQLLKDYETLLKQCESSRDMLTSETIRIINFNLVQLQDIQARLSGVQMTASAAQAQVATAGALINDLKKDLKKIKRRIWLERASGTLVIAALTFFLLKTYLK